MLTYEELKAKLRSIRKPEEAKAFLDSCSPEEKTVYKGYKERMIVEMTADFASIGSAVPKKIKKHL